MTWMVLLQNIWVRRALLAVGVFAMLFAVREHYVHLGERRGAVSEQVTLAAEGEGARSEERKDALVQINSLRDQLVQVERGSKAALSAAKQSSDSAVSLAARQQQARAEVENMPIEALHATNMKALGGASGAEYGSAQEREIAACLAERPLCEKRASALEDANRALEQAITDAQKARELQQRQYESLADYTGQLERRYTSLYNNVPRKRNWAVSLLTLGMRGKPKRLAVPKLEELKRGSFQEAD